MSRNAEVALGRPASGSAQGERHPPERVSRAFQRVFDDILLDLSQADGHAFIDALIDSQPSSSKSGGKTCQVSEKGIISELLQDQNRLILRIMSKT